MVRVAPFKGIIYNQAVIKDLSKVIAPPYDVISCREQEQLYQKSPYNIVRLILGKEFPADTAKNNRYRRAEKFLSHWLKQKILKQDQEPAFYLYRNEFFFQKKRFARLGFIGLIKLDKNKKVVFPHEKVLAAPLEDRLKLIRRVKCNLSPIFTLFSDHQKRIQAYLVHLTKTAPFADIRQDGFRHRLWRVTEKGQIKKIQKLLSSAKILIADGHHRYEVAGRFCLEQMRKKKFRASQQYVMAYLNSMLDRGLLILPVHRMVKAKRLKIDEKKMLLKLRQFFALRQCRSVEELLEGMRKEKGHIFGFYQPKLGLWLLYAKRKSRFKFVSAHSDFPLWNKLDVVILQDFILKKLLRLRPEAMEITYSPNAHFVFQQVKKNKCDFAFFLKPMQVKEVATCAQAGLRMPPKSTFFYPKVLSGLVINPLFCYAKPIGT